MTARGGLLALVIAGVCWGSTGTLGTLFSRSSGLSFLPIAGYRIAVGGLLLLLFALLTRNFRPPRTRRGWVRLGLLGACAGTYQFGFFSGVGLIGVPLATLIATGAAPVQVLCVDVATGHRRLNAGLIATMVLALIGLGLLIGAPPPDLSMSALVPGILFALLAASAFAAITLLGGRPDPDFQDLTGTALAFLAGGLAVLFVAAVRGTVGFAPSPTSVALVVSIGLVPTAVAYLAYLTGLRHQGSMTGSLVSLLEPLTAATLAALVLGQWLTPVAMVGAGLVLAAVALTGAGGALSRLVPARRGSL